MALNMYKKDQITVKQICAQFGIGRTTFYRYLHDYAPGLTSGNK